MINLLIKVWGKVKEKILRIRFACLDTSFNITSHLTIPERVILYKITSNASTIVEIGSYIGASACCFGEALKERGEGNVFCIDTWNNDAMSEGNRNTWIEFQNNTKTYKEYIIPIRGFSTDVVELINKQAPSLDVLFIDGDHSYQGVKADWLAYKSLLKSGSIVIFHDYGWAEGVKKVINEDVMPLVSEYNMLPNMWWGTIS